MTTKNRKKPGPKKFLSKDLFFSVDPSKIKYFSTGRIVNLKPIKKHRRKKIVKITFCQSNGTGLLEASKIEFSKAVRA